MKDRLIAGIDLGSSAIRLAVGQIAQTADKREIFSIVGAVEVPSQGISKGAISSLEDAVTAISSCLEQAERQIGLPVAEAYIGLNGTYVTVQAAKGVIGVSRPDSEIREEDVNRVLESARSLINPANYEVLHVLPRAFVIDGQAGIKDPVGMQGIRLEAEVHVIQGLTTHVRNLTNAVFRTGLDVTELVFAPLAASDAVTTPKQREVGVAVVNIGGATTSLVIYEEGELLHACVIPIGSDHVTSDIAIGLRTSLDVAEQFKRQHVSALAEKVAKYDEVDLQDLGADQSERVSPRFVSDIAQARVEEIFEKVEQELKKLNRSGMLPAGIILTGSGAKLRGIVDIAKKTLRLPVTLGTANQAPSPLTEVIQDPSYSSAIGLVLWGYGNERQTANGNGSFKGAKPRGEIMKKFTSPLKKIFKSFVP